MRWARAIFGCQKEENSAVTYMYPNTALSQNDGRMLHQNRALKNPRYMKK